MLDKNTILLLHNAISKKDEITAIHSVEVGLLCKMITEKFVNNNITLPFDLETAYVAGLLHDVGKLKMSDKVLKGTEKFSSPKDNLEILMHPIHGYNILTGLDFENVITESVLSHHERKDGSGYPNGIIGNKITMLSSIIGIADTYSAITQKRYYKKEKTKKEALEILEKDSYLFNSKVLEMFFEIINEKIITEELA